MKRSRSLSWMCAQQKEGFICCLGSWQLEREGTFIKPLMQEEKGVWESLVKRPFLFKSEEERKEKEKIRRKEDILSTPSSSFYSDRPIISNFLFKHELAHDLPFI